MYHRTGHTDRAILYDRINRRWTKCCIWIGRGSKQVLSEQDGKTALQAIGYKELLPYFQENFT
ncbi:MAG: hypothetical protein ACLSCV_03420 [Acutalibacteraceae bacterium]